LSYNLLLLNLYAKKIDFAHDAPMNINPHKTTDSSTKQILDDYLLASISREISLLGRKEVFMGKAKFGIFGDGKEVAQIALSKVFMKGDWRSGYYRDQTLMMALGELSPQQFFAQLYAHADIKHDPSSAGRMMNGHFGSRSLDDLGNWKVLMDQYNSSSDISPTAAQMPRLLGLGLASKLFRNNPELASYDDFSHNGNEVAFGTIGNASTSEGHFFESLNAAGVLQIPIVLAVWDDGYGISVPNQIQTIKESISEALKGFQKEDGSNGIEIMVARGWNYLELVATFQKATELARKEHIPCLVHVTELTQPQGHSTSGSHERYKSKDRLLWEQRFDCNLKMKEWILEEKLASSEDLNQLEKEAKSIAKNSRNEAWSAYIKNIKADQKIAVGIISAIIKASPHKIQLLNIQRELQENATPLRADIFKACRTVLWELTKNKSEGKSELKNWLSDKYEEYSNDYSSHLSSESEEAANKIVGVKPVYGKDPIWVDGRKILNICFDHHLATNPLFFALGEDVGEIGDVNQGFSGLQKKYSALRVMDTGIRENSIIGKGIGAALRGLRPIAEIQYLDYLIYAIQTLSDDLATLHHRTRGGQKAPLIIRTRGHRLEGMWHSGSPMGMILNSLRGIHVLVPRNMTQAAGFYNTLLMSDDPAIVIETLNGYRLKEKIPENIFEMRTPLGIPEILLEGTDLTLVTYGSMCRLALEASELLRDYGISIEIIDVQTLLPFDLNGTIVHSLKKTNAILFADEDVPGGASAFMMQQVLEKGDGYQWLDTTPRTLTSKDHRPVYGSDGDYFSKPSVEDLFEMAYSIMHERDPQTFLEI
jgi:2-oxoisovalerate dehydrogenase E1 component